MNRNIQVSNPFKKNSFITFNHYLDPPLPINVGDVVYTRKQIKTGKMYFPRFTKGLILESGITQGKKNEKDYEQKAYLVKLQVPRELEEISNLKMNEHDLIIEYNPIKHSQLYLVESFVKELPFLDIKCLKKRAITKRVVVRRSGVFGGSVQEYDAFPFYAVIENVITGFIVSKAPEITKHECSVMSINELMTNDGRTQLHECINEFTTEFAIKSGFYIDFSQL